jgi:hypothetical protein
MKEIMFRRMSIAVGAGNVLSVDVSAKNLSEALDEELTYYRRAGRVPAEIIISRMD